MPAVLQSILAFLVVLGVLVFVHEFGHYLAARLVRVHVEVFSIGFGPAIATWRDRVGTVWKLAWLPLGGYVKLHGHERPEVVAANEPAGTASDSRWIPGRVFHEKPSARALSSSPPDRSPISFWPWCCSPCCSPPPGGR